MTVDRSSRPRPRRQGQALLLGLLAVGALTFAPRKSDAAAPPAGADGLLRTTRDSLEAYRFADALRAADLWVERRPKDARALLWRGRVYERLARLDAALHDYRQAVALDPKNAQARLHLGQVLVERKDPVEARKHFEWLLGRRPEDPAVLLGLVRCRALLGQLTAARDMLDKLLKKYPRHAGALTERGKLALFEGKFREAEAWLRKALKEDPARYETLYALSRCLFQSGRREEAQRYLVQLRRLQEDLKRLDRILRAELARKPNDPSLRLEAGTICLRLGQTKEGLRLLASALKADPRHRPTHRALAEYYERTGDRTRAVAHRRLAEGER
jgi:predicted Zn-dependent protease